MKNPESLTKDQLKEVLLANGVELPKGRVLKAAYVELYNTHILDNFNQTSTELYQSTNGRTAKASNKQLDAVNELPGSSDRSSSSEKETEKQEVQARFRRVSRVKENDASGEKKDVIIMSDNEMKGKRDSKMRNKTLQKLKSEIELLDDLTNAEITARLRSLGHSVGPIGPSTRKVYLKKLIKLLESGDVLDSQEQSFEEEIVLPDSPPVTRSVSKRRSVLQDMQPIASIRKNTTSQASVNTESNILETSSSNKSPEKETQTEADADEKEETDKPSLGKIQSIKPERSWIPIWIQILVAILVVIIAYMWTLATDKNPPPLSLPKRGSV